MEIWRVIHRKGVNVREHPSEIAKKKDILPYNTIIEVSKRDGLWLQCDKGWVLSNVKGHQLLSYEKNPRTRAIVTDNETTEEESSGYDAFAEGWFFEGGQTQSTTTWNADIANINAILGLPYQFLPNADARLLDKNGNIPTDPMERGRMLGRVYSDKIVSKIPLLLITPGRPEFMTRYSGSEREGILAEMLSGNDLSNASKSNLLTADGRYYTLRFDHVRYFNFVNPLCRIAAQYLGIGDKTLDGVPLKYYNWGDGSVDPGDPENPPSFLKDKLQSFLNTGVPGCIGFYIDSDTQVSESFGNSTSQSSFASTINGFQEKAKELQFLMGYGSAALDIDFLTDFVNENSDINKNIENVNDLVGSLLGGNNFLQSLSSNLVTVAQGGRLLFPEIWSDASFGKSYNITKKYISPDPDVLSVYLNVLVPFFHDLALVAPQSVNLNPNGYTAPFLIRAMYKGMLNIETGIITSMDVTRGSEGGWTKEGIPTSMEVNITIKDLYEAMSVTNMQDTGKYDTMNNTALMDYVANICGINVFKPEVGRQIDMWFAQHVPAKAQDTLFNIFGNIEQSMMSAMYNLFEKTPFFR